LAIHRSTSGESQSFGCCSSWPHCSVVGYCVQAETEEEMEWYLKHCSLAGNLFVHRKEGWAETWTMSSIRSLSEGGNSENEWGKAILEFHASNGESVAVLSNGKPIFDPVVKGWCDQVGSRILERNNRPPQKQSRPVSTSGNGSSVHTKVNSGDKYALSYRGLSLYYGGGKITMSAKVVQDGTVFDVISWTHRDLVQYGIREKATGNLVETFSPNAELKGWALRKHVIAEHALWEENPAIKMEDDTFRNTVVGVDDIRVGYYMTYWNPSKKEYVYCKVINITDIFVYYVKPDGDKFFWLKETLQTKMDEGLVKCVAQSQIPEPIKFPEEE